jgi:hypothetical protein
MPANRTQDLLAAYGADPARWPERPGDAPDAAELAAARALDDALDRLTAPPPDPLLRTRILARVAGQAQPSVTPAVLSWRSRIVAVWQPLATLAAAAMLGWVVGWTDAVLDPPPITEDAVMVSMLDGLD